MNKLAITWINSVIQKKQPQLIIDNQTFLGKEEKPLVYASQEEFDNEVKELKRMLFNTYNHTVGLKRTDLIFSKFIKPLFEDITYLEALERISRNANRHWTLMSKEMTKEQVLDEKDKTKELIKSYLKIGLK